MDSFLHWLREYPALAGIGLFVLVSALLAVVLGRAMLKAGGSLKPLVFLFGFFTIVGGPQAVVHGLDALAHRQQVDGNDGANGTHGPAAGLAPVAWEAVFGPGADPSLMTDPRAGLGAILGSATEAKLSFSSTGQSALAARFASAGEAAAALNTYGTFFQFAQASGSDAAGWTARRFNGQGEWNHVVAAGNELYAWTGPTRESVLAGRERALGPLPAAASTAATSPSGSDPARTLVSRRLSDNTPVMLAFLGINLALAAGWFFKASAWATRVRPAPGVQPVDGGALRSRIVALNGTETPVEVSACADGRSLEVTWRYADARWFDLMQLNQVRRVHKLVLTFDEGSRKVRVTEYWSAFDGSAGREGVRLQWQAAAGMQFFQVEQQRVFGVQLDAEGKPTGELSRTFRFNLQAMKGPLIEAVTGAGWTWQPVMWKAPAALRWLTE